VTDPIRIHHADDDAEAHARHARIEARLEELGMQQVRQMMGIDLPAQWNPIIRAWLAGKKLKPREEA